MSEDNKELKAYITKLNDRNIQRQRESGLTEYAILGIIGFFCFKIIEDAKFFLLYNQYKNEILIVFLTISLLVALTMTYEFIRNILYNQRLQINPALEYLDSKTSALINFCIWISYTSIGFICLKLFDKNSEIIYQIKLILGVFSFHLFMFLFSFFAFLNQGIEETFRIKYPISKKAKIIMSTLFLSMLLLLTKSIFEIYFKFNLNEKLLVGPLKLGVNIYLLSHFILLYRKHKLEKNKYFWLEKLEIDMQLGNIDNNEIIELLEINYFGTNFSKWMKYNNKYLHQIEHQLEKEFILIEEIYRKIIRDNYGSFSEREKVTKDLIKEIESILKNFNHQTRKIKMRIKLVKSNAKLTSNENYYVDNFEEGMVNIDTKYISKLEEFKDLLSEND